MFSYVDDNAAVWNKRGQVEAGINAIDGSTVLTPGQPVWEDGGRYSTRKAIFYDPTTFRTVKFTVYTPAAFAAITSATTLNVSVPGEAAAVAYSLSAKIAEKQPVAKTARQLPDHA